MGVSAAIEFNDTNENVEVAGYDFDIEKKLNISQKILDRFKTETYSLSSSGGVVKLVITPACHAGGRGFKSRRSRHLKKIKPFFRVWLFSFFLTS